MSVSRFKWVLLLLVIMIGHVVMGCGARIDQTIEVNPDGSGQIVIVGVDEIRDINESIKDGLDSLKPALQAKVPSNWHLEITSGDGKATFTVTTTFQNIAELRQRLKDATGSDNAVDWTIERTPFYQRDEIQVASPHQAWAKWAVDTVATLTRESAIERVVTHVKWPGRDRQVMSGWATNEERRSVESLAMHLTWGPTGITRAIDLRPSHDQPLFQPLNDWIKETIPIATITESEGTYHILLTDTKTPWNTDLKVTHNRHNLFWDHIVLQEPTVSAQQWLGPKVEVQELTYHFNGSGWWSTDEQGPPKWYRWPLRSSSFTVDQSTPAVTVMVGYIPRTPLYVAWGLVPLLAMGMGIGIPIGIKRTRKHWPTWAATLRGGLRVSTNVHPKFCSECGQQLGEAPCACGAVAATADLGMRVGDAPPVGMWAKYAMDRIKRVFLMDLHTFDVPIQASVMSMLARALLLAFIFHRLVNELFSQALSAVGRSVPLLGFLGTTKQALPAFGWILLALLLASGAGQLMLYLRSGQSQISTAAAALSDAQWPVAFGAVAAWVLSYLWLPLSIGAFLAGVAWGQAVLTLGLGRLQLSHRQRIGMQVSIAFATVLVMLLVMGKATEKMLQGLG